MRHFEVESWRTVVSPNAYSSEGAEAIVKLRLPSGERALTVGEGNGPVNALDNALRAAVTAGFPAVTGLELVDYKVRILPNTLGTEAVTRVLVTTRDDAGEWTTVGVHENVIVASWLALVDAVDYGLLRAGE